LTRRVSPDSELASLSAEAGASPIAPVVSGESAGSACFTRRANEAAEQTLPLRSGSPPGFADEFIPALPFFGLPRF